MRNQDFMEHARECFRQAAADGNPGNMRLLAEFGLEYLRLAVAGRVISRNVSDNQTGFNIH